jgi:RNA recognition motif-containing protein
MSDPQIYVRGFPKTTRESDLKDLFGKYGSIREVRIIRDYAFIVNHSFTQVFINKDDAVAAVEAMDG